MNYTYKDEPSMLRAGDTLELEDGTRHEAINDCRDCSLKLFPEECKKIRCDVHYFHFKKIEP
jgi:hypothetical protein